MYCLSREFRDDTKSCKLLDEELERRDGMMDNSRTRDGY